MFSAAQATSAQAQNPQSQTSSATAPTLSGLVLQLRAEAKSLEGSTGMRSAYQAFLSAHKLNSSDVAYSDFVIVRLVYEGSRDAGFWNLHWEITDKPPNSDNIWRQWTNVKRPSVVASTATA